MAQDNKWFERFSRCVDRWFDSLNAGKEHRPYRITTYPHARKLLFALVQKPVDGSRLHTDGTRWRHFIGPTMDQAEMLCKTSPTDHELIRRLELLVLQGQDTTSVPSTMARAEQPQLTEAQINQLVDQKVEAILRQKLEQIAASQAEKLVVRPVEPLPQGLQERPPRKAPKEYARIRDQNHEMWADRAKLMGGPAPIFTSTGQLHKNWLRAAEQRWERYNQPTATSGPETPA
jgi:hypothetical protein